MLEFSIQPFRFKKLPKITRDEVYFFSKISHLLSPSASTQEIVSTIFHSIENYVHQDIQWTFVPQGTFLSFQQLQKTCFPPTFLAHVALLPISSRILIEFDPVFVRILVDHALGGTLQNGVRDAFTEIEEGVFRFFLLKSMQHFQQTIAQQNELEVRLENIHASLEPILETTKEEELFFCKEIRTEMVGHQSVIRVYIPMSIMQESRLQSPLPSPKEQLELLHANLSRFGQIPVTGRIQIGMVELSEADLAGLEVNDIVLLGECSATQKKDGILQGTATLNFSQNANVSLQCTIQDTPSHPKSQIKFEKIIPTPQPENKGTIERSEYSMDEPKPSPDEFEENPNAQQNENAEEMGEILNDVPVPLVVELGRIECRVKDLASFQIGQTMELRRSPYEPLDLVVNGQILGKGELVEIEGQIGIRIIELLK